MNRRRPAEKQEQDNINRRMADPMIYQEGSVDESTINAEAPEDENDVIDERCNQG